MGTQSNPSEQGLKIRPRCREVAARAIAQLIAGADDDVEVVAIQWVVRIPLGSDVAHDLVHRLIEPLEISEQYLSLVRFPI
jgi:hypothetical protein